jgi:hypothetical protein
MNLRAYLLSLELPQRVDFIKRLKKHPNYIHALSVETPAANGTVRRPSPALARAIEKHSNRKVRRWELLPEVYEAPVKKTNGSAKPKRVKKKPVKRKPAVKKKPAPRKPVKRKSSRSAVKKKPTKTKRRA